MQAQRSYPISSRDASFTPIQREQQAYFHAPTSNSTSNASNYALTYDLIYGPVNATNMNLAVPVDQNAFYNPFPGSTNAYPQGHPSTAYQTGVHSTHNACDTYFAHPSDSYSPNANEWLSMFPPTEAAMADKTRAFPSQLSYAPSTTRQYEPRISGSASRNSASTMASTTTSTSRPSSSGSSSSRSSLNSGASASSAATSHSSSSRPANSGSSQQTLRFVTVDPTSAAQSQSTAFAMHSPPNIPQRLYISTSPPCDNTASYISFSDHRSAGVRLVDLLDTHWRDDSLNDYVLQDETSQNATLRVWWPHESAHRRAGLPLKSYGRDGGSITRRQLGQRVAHSLRRIFEESDMHNFEATILVGLQRVGRGSWQPVLRVI